MDKQIPREFHAQGMRSTLAVRRITHELLYSYLHKQDHTEHDPKIPRSLDRQDR